MAVTDSVSIFAEGTFEEQIQELVNYIVRNRSEEERGAFIRPFQDALKTEEGGKSLDEDEVRRQRIFSMLIVEVKGLGEGSDKEIEGFFNLLFSHLFSLFPSDSTETKQFLLPLLQTISSAPSTHNPIKYRVLSNLFNAIPRTSPLRLAVYNTLLATASSRDDLEVLQLSQTAVEKWLSEWDVSSEDKSTFLKSIVDAYATAHQPIKSYEYSLLYVRSLPPSSSQAQEAAVETIAAALRLPAILDFSPLFKLDAIIALKDHELFSLLKIFLNDGLTEFQSWEANKSNVLEKYNLDKSQLEHKIRLLTLSSLAFTYIGRDLPYSVIATTLQTDPSQAEKWVIDVIRAGLITGKLSQTTQTLHVTRSTTRAFEREHWEILEKRLVRWKVGLSGVLEVIASARRQSGHAPTTIPAAA